MSLSKLFRNFVDAGTDKCKKDFQHFPEAIQIVMYQKLLFKAGEGNESATAILNELVEFESKPEIHSERLRYEVARANAIYQDYLYQKALAKAAASKEEDLLFDPQGRLIYELKLTPVDQAEVIASILRKPFLDKPLEEELDYQTIKKQLKSLLGGRTPTDTTLCSIDLTGNEPAHSRDTYLNIKNLYESKYGATKNIPSHQRTSIIASFEETYAHMCLMARTYEQRSRTEGFDAGNDLISPEKWQEIRQKASIKIQNTIVSLYQEALAKATDSKHVIDVEKLNELLGKKRNTLAQFAKETLIEEVIAHLKLPQADRNRVLDYMHNLCKRLDKKHTFTQQTATGYDYFYTSDYLQQGMLITGTNDTAHNKPEFKSEKDEDQAAFRRVSYTYRDNNGILQATPAVSARIPSPALVFDKKMSPDKIKEDLCAKYGFLQEQMRIMRGGKKGPVVENVFTSFHSAAYEYFVDGRNRQRTTVLYMMQAMHEFNRQQLMQQPKDNNFIYVQNIGTNRHTRDLGYRVDRTFGILTGSVGLDDITLSTEMAMLHTLQENSAYLSTEINRKISRLNQKILGSYCNYLKQDNRSQYFSESEEGLSVIKEIRNFKKQLETSLRRELRQQKNDSNDLSSLVAHALIKMMTSNHHWNIRYGQLSQVLSMYLEWASTGGCKSGNERNQDVMLRFALLKSIHERVEHNNGDVSGLQEHEKEIYNQLRGYARDQAADPDVLRATISLSVRKSNMHGGATAISREDQGGAAKISSFSYVQDIQNPLLRWVVRFFAAIVLLPAWVIPGGGAFYASQIYDTNNAADREMHLDAFGASKTQAHKGQDKQTRKAVLNVLKRDDLFSINTLSNDERLGFNEDKALCKEINASFQQPIRTISSSLRRLSDGGDNSEGDDSLLLNETIESMERALLLVNEVERKKEVNSHLMPDTFSSPMKMM